MKQIPMTAELSKLIKDRVGDDVDTANLAVFETIALNTKPLPGKDGTIFEDAVVVPVTLAQMVDYIISGNHLPVVINHDLANLPTGRFFHAGLYSDDNSLEELEMRALFYLDATEEKLIHKLNSASLDEVSVAFLASAFLCSECGWDYFSQGEPENIATRTCANGHTIGEDGVHAEMVGLSKFIELSLVARGAADKPKIVGKSQSKLAPESVYRLAAKGFEPDGLIVQASMSKEEDMDTTKLVTDLTEAKSALALSAAEVTRLTASTEALTTKLTASETRVGELETELAAAKDAKPEDYETDKAALTEARSLLQSQLNSLRVASGEAKLEDDKLPSEIAELKTQIEDLTGKLTALLPTDGVALAAGKSQDEPKRDFSSFKVTKE
jgi:hypothetical protein